MTRLRFKPIHDAEKQNTAVVPKHLDDISACQLQYNAECDRRY